MANYHRNGMDYVVSLSRCMVLNVISCIRVQWKAAIRQGAIRV